MKLFVQGRRVRSRAAAAVAALVLIAPTCSDGTIETPAFAFGVPGPAVVDHAGVVAEWELLGEQDAEMSYPAGVFDDDFGVFGATADSTEVVVAWSALPCQRAPVAEVTVTDAALHIAVTPGPKPEERCAAMAVPWAFRLELTRRLADLAISAELIDPVAQRRFDFP